MTWGYLYLYGPLRTHFSESYVKLWAVAKLVHEEAPSTLLLLWWLEGTYIFMYPSEHTLVKVGHALQTKDTSRNKAYIRLTTSIQRSYLLDSWIKRHKEYSNHTSNQTNGKQHMCSLTLINRTSLFVYAMPILHLKLARWIQFQRISRYNNNHMYNIKMYAV